MDSLRCPERRKDKHLVVLSFPWDCLCWREYDVELLQLASVMKAEPRGLCAVWMCPLDLVKGERWGLGWY